jgi:formate--tetrahydrofolate ligase
MAFDAVHMADWQNSEQAENNMPPPDEWRDQLGLEKDQVAGQTGRKIH